MTDPEVKTNSETLAELLVPAVYELGHVAMLFAHVERGTADLDGNAESDTDHTVMLGLIACSLAPYDPRLNVGKVAQYALVHDLVEVYAGDTVTLHQDRVDHVAKKVREMAALEQLKAQFVKTLDKSMPAITHLFNDSVSVLGEFESADQVRENSRKHTEQLANTYGADHPLVIALRKLVSEKFAQSFAMLKLNMQAKLY